MATQRIKSAAQARKQKPLPRKAKLLGLAAACLLAPEIVLTSLAASHGDYSDDISAADYAETSQVAATAAAGQRLTQGDFAGAKVFATHALSVSPISVASLRNLGLAEQGLGNGAKAAALFSQTAALGWRDGPTQLLLAQAFLQQKDFGAAAQRVDAALRADPLSTDLYQMLDQQISNPAFAKAMAERLELDPEWRSFYFRSLDQISLPALLSRYNVMIFLSNSAAPPSREEVIPTLYALFRANRPDLARVLWSRSQRIAANDVYDPNFTRSGTSDMAPFEWTVFPVPGASLTIEQQGAGNVLRARTDGSTAGTLLRQSIALRPGVHSLNYIGTIPSSARDAFGWSIRCTNSGRMLLNSVHTASQPPYRFDVPDDCKGQRVELLVTSSAKAAGDEAQFTRLDID